MSTQIELVQRAIFSPVVRNNFSASLSDENILFEKEAGFAMQALQSNDYLCKISAGNQQSLINAITNIAAIGVSLNPAKKQAYLVPRDGKVCLDISYMGLMDLAMATGAILWGQAIIVRNNDDFQLMGLDQKPHHKFNPFSKDRGEIVGVYVVVKTQHCDYLTHTMAIDVVNAIRNRSSAWKSGKTCPWHTDPEEMTKKTCIKQACKYWPRNARLDVAVHHLNTEGGEGISEIDMGTVICDQVDVEQAEIRINEQINQADLTSLWQSLVAECRAKKDTVAYEAIKKAVTAKGEQLKAVAP